MVCFQNKKMMVCFLSLCLFIYLIKWDNEWNRPLKFRYIIIIEWKESFSFIILLLFITLNKIYNRINLYLNIAIFLLSLIINLFTKNSIKRKNWIKINCNRMVAKLYPVSFEILICLFLYHLLFAVHVDLNSKKVIDSHLILEE